MKLSKDYQYQILCEDVQMRGFILSFLGAQDIKSQKVRVRNYPCGKGCGEAFVRRELPGEVKILHATNYIRKVLIVCSDADNLSVDKRIKLLLQNIENDYIKLDRAIEPIVFWIPKRQIETWIHFLNGESVDEMESFAHDGNRPESCKRVASIFSEYCQGLRDIDCKNIPSLLTAKCEYERVCELQKNASGSK